MQNKAMELFPCLESSGAELGDSTPVHGVPDLPLMVSLLLRNLSFPFSPASILYSTQICMLPPHSCPKGDLILITIHAFFACDYLLLECLFSSSESVLPPYKPCLPFNSLKKSFHVNLNTYDLLICPAIALGSSGALVLVQYKICISNV